jgi:16S rRNA (uracil1498-N3)-methyltransferase
LVQAITKSDRNKEMLELITAAGVDQVIPWQAERSISKWQDDSERKWLITIKESCKQSRRIKVPRLRQVMNTTSLAKEFNSKNLGLVFHESGQVKFADAQFGSNLDAVYLIIGPEGGITDNELSIFQGAGSMILRLGPTVLRSAHAGFAALAAVQTKLGRW